MSLDAEPLAPHRRREAALVRSGRSTDNSVREVAGLRRRRFALRRDGRDLAHIQMGLADGRMEHSRTRRDPSDSPLFLGPVGYTSAFDAPCCVRLPRPSFDRLRRCASTRRLSLTRAVGDPSNSSGATHSAGLGQSALTRRLFLAGGVATLRSVLPTLLPN